ncbi:MAG: Rieske (2Fe-2S) protein, partial [Acidobacteria bacterium]|nr:Rieske (2Fe-2S) protein [Acidobacteriota bacterium]
MTDQRKTLPASYYTNREIYHAELENLFCRMWICAGRSERIANPGDYFLCEVAGESLIVTCDGDTIRAFYNVCRHRGTQLCVEAEGHFGGPIRCPYHGWSYGLDGRLVGAPHMDERAFRREQYPLHAVQAEEWDGYVFVNLA